ncbi:hypothetical protein DYI23_05690 [Roseibium polysiphoniae]|uniref:Apea-like HEPN domain-containing protein n=1 Tax=Roseibium polysiphoniae TaxID=2571221 RepID=A0A944GSQ3_9HYPH|nr:HEPN domain-containing protein [Roseibium polysiphoniae]MBS8259705.1 hypothetical protein [Roseibium polysiphoniae]
MIIDKKTLVEDVVFIIDELFRFQKMLQEDPRLFFYSCSQNDVYYTIPDPANNCNFIIGYHAGERLRGLARKCLLKEQLENQISLSSAYDAVRKEISIRILKNRIEPNESSVERLLSAAAKKLRNNLRNETHYLPCRLMYRQSPELFSVGPVRFLTQRKFREVLTTRLKEGRKTSGMPDKDLLFDAIRYYKSYQWVAEVAILNCDKTTSESRAAKVVKDALNCLHVLLGYSHTSDMRIAGPSGTKETRGTISFLENNLCSVSVSFSGHGAIGFEDDWYHAFERPDYAEALKLCGIALETALHPTSEHPISARYLEAAHWFGEATRETEPAAKAVKYVTSIERLLMTNEQSDISTTVAERLSAVCSVPVSGNGRDEWRAKTQRAYRLRSKLVHGSLSPHSEEVREAVMLSSELSETVLRNMLFAFGEDGLKKRKFSDKRLANWFRKIVNQADELCNS